MINKKDHCSNCGVALKISFHKASERYRYLECNNYIPKECKRHGKVGFNIEKNKKIDLNYRCKSCGHKEIKNYHKKISLGENKDKLFKELNYDRKMIRAIQKYHKNNDDQALVNSFYESLNRKDSLQKLDELIFPTEFFNEIIENTECDKNTQKSQLKNIVYWFMSTFVFGNLESLAIKAASSNSERYISRSLTNDTVISNNALGVRLGNDKVILALERLLQLSTGLFGTNIFNEEETLRPVFYDWSYITKNGGNWKVCHKLGKGDDSHGFKIGFGVDLKTKAIVSLVFHGEVYPNDNLSFQRDLCIKDIPGLIQISDRGPFDTHFMNYMHKKSQFFAIRLKKKV